MPDPERRSSLATLTQRLWNQACVGQISDKYAFVSDFRRRHQQLSLQFVFNVGTKEKTYSMWPHSTEPIRCPN
eukprot:349735-Chlamydomonas_euryale.AAC.3